MVSPAVLADLTDHQAAQLHHHLLAEMHRLLTDFSDQHAQPAPEA